MKTKRPPKSIRKYIREQKAKIRREIFDTKEQKKKIWEVYQKFGIVRKKIENNKFTSRSETVYIEE